MNRRLLLALLLCMLICNSCSILQRAAIPIAVGTTAGVFAGPVGIIVALAASGATWATAIIVEHINAPAQEPPPIPWYLDPWSWIRLLIGFIVLVFMVKLLSTRYRKHFLSGIANVLKLRVREGVKRIGAAEGLLHTEQVEKG